MDNNNNQKKRSQRITISCKPSKRILKYRKMYQDYVQNNSTNQIKNNDNNDEEKIEIKQSDDKHDYDGFGLSKENVLLSQKHVIEHINNNVTIKENLVECIKNTMKNCNLNYNIDKQSFVLMVDNSNNVQKTLKKSKIKNYHELDIFQGYNKYCPTLFINCAIKLNKSLYNIKKLSQYYALYQIESYGVLSLKLSTNISQNKFNLFVKIICLTNY